MRVASIMNYRKYVRMPNDEFAAMLKPLFASYASLEGIAEKLGITMLQFERLMMHRSVVVNAKIIRKIESD